VLLLVRRPRVEKSLSDKLADYSGLSWLKGATKSGISETAKLSSSLSDSTTQGLEKAGGFFKGLWSSLATEPTLLTPDGSRPAAAMSAADGDEALARAFAAIDANGSGKISRDNLDAHIEKVFGKQDPAVIDEMMRAADKDRDHEVGRAATTPSSRTARTLRRPPASARSRRLIR
jgi:hypothetical protein